MKSFQALSLFIGLAAAGTATLNVFSDQCGQDFVHPGSSKRGFRTGFNVNNDSQCVKLAFDAQGVLVINATPDLLNGRNQLQLHALEDCTGQFDPISDIQISGTGCISDGSGATFKAVRIVPLTPPPS